MSASSFGDVGEWSPALTALSSVPTLRGASYFLPLFSSKIVSAKSRVSPRLL
jgi:hypothetical protein